MSIKQNSELIIFVTHIEPCHTFLRIWGQIDKNSATCVERMILPLVEQFTRRQNCVKTQSTSLRINALCCAKFQNDGYYRARIKHINNIDNTVLLHFIDYGNLELFPIQEIHLLDDIPGSESLQSFPPVAFQFTLMHLLPVNGHWSNEVIESIQKTLRYNEYKIVIHTITNSDNFIKLVYNDEDFTELLIRRYIAKKATLLEMYSSRGITDPELLLYEKNLSSLHSAENEVQEFQQNVCSCCAAQQKHTMHASVQEALVFKSRILDVSSKHDVYVSFVEDGPYKFSVQLQSTTQVLRVLMRDINSHPLEPLQEPPLPGSVCLGRYTRDKVLCRAVVMSVMENKCKLYYVDFGHTEVLPYTDIFKLPPHFINPRVLSIRFTLSGVHELNVTGTMKEYFKQVLAGKLLVLHVCPPEGPPLVQYGDLYDNGRNIKDILREAFPPPVMLKSINCFTYQTPKSLSVEDVVNVYVSFVESYKKFFVRLEDYVPSLELIMNDLADFCTTAPTLSLAELKVGLPCAALYDDQWYRAQILDINGEKLKVLYVDYGNEEIVTLKSLRSIRADLVKTLPAQAIKCILHGHRVIEPTQETHDRFESYTLEKRFHIKVIDINFNGLVVDLYEKEHNMNILSELFHIVPVEHVRNQYSFKLILKTDENEDVNKWFKKNQSISLHQTHNSSSDQEMNKFKIFKNESSSHFHHNDSQNERFNRDESSNNRSTKDKWSNRHDGNDSSKIGKGTRGNRNRASDTSLKGNTKHGKSSTNRGSYSRRGGISERIQSNKFSDRNNDGNYRSGKTNGDYHDSNRSKERKGQGYRLVQNKLNIANYTCNENVQNSMKHKNNFYIPHHTITTGIIKPSEVVVINSLCDFFVQLNSDYIALETMMENMASVYENGGNLLPELNMFCGTYCVAQYSKDLKWYRAVIKFINEDDVTVQFVDYGNIETVKFCKIKTIQKEFLELPIQAIHCKLFGVRDDNIDSKKIEAFENLVINKTVEAEFISEENGMYSVLLKRMTDNGQTEIFINREFCEDTELTKENITEWSTIPYAPGTKKDVIITWFTNPNNFYCQILDNENEFKFMMNEIQRIYVTKKPISYMLQVGSPVVAIFSDDGAFYRAEIIELNKLNGHLVQYIDFGNSAIVDPQNIYPVEKELMRLPKQAVQCSLLNVAPLDGSNWSEANTKEIDNCFNVDNCTCVFHDKKDNKYLISLINNGDDVAKMLAKLNLASLSNSGTKSDVDVKDNNTSKPIIKSNIKRVDINLLNGQALRVKVSSVQNMSEFYVQLPSATECEDIINTYMADKNPEVMQRLSAHEICPGTGCLVDSNGVWRRAVISSRSQSTGFNVKFIDTGAYHEILSDSVLALPGELSVMQYQSIECSLVRNTISETNTKFKEIIEGKEVIIKVEEIDNNRLIVKLFDLNGYKINISEKSDEKILPICPLPILSSTQKVIAIYIEHSGSIWLKFVENHPVEENLLRALNKYYPTSGKLWKPQYGRLCAVQSSNGQWYRARVIGISEKRGIYINYIDFGNSAFMHHNGVMMLDSQFYTPHQLAINVSLSVIIKGTVFEQSNILEHHLKEKWLTCVFHNVNKRWVVELLYNGEKFSSKFRSLNLISEKKIYGLTEATIYNMTEGCKYKVSVSYADSPSQFWLRREDDFPDLHSKHTQLQQDAPTFPEIDGILEEGSLCIVSNNINGYWYRAQVLDADEDITTVRLIDLGSTDIINNKSGKIRQLPDEWKEIKGYAVKCRLDVIPAEAEDWNSAICKRFESIVKVESLEAMVIANSVPKRVDLLINGKSVSEMLVENHYAVKIHTEEELIDEIVDLELDPYSAFVSHINSPNEFWVQEEKSIGDLEIMADRFIVAHLFSKVHEIKENLLCVAKYPEDECWYRARVVSHSDSVTQVIYIDYGNSATSTEIRALPLDLVDVPPLSRKCRLIMPEGITKWSEKACKEFVRLSGEGAAIFLLDVIDEGETSLVKLTLNGENVTDILAKFCEPPIIEKRLSPLGEADSSNVFVSCINSPNEFWIQAESNTTDLNIMLERLQAAPSFLPLSIFDIGTICAAKYLENGQWRRAKILSHSEEGTEVLCIDYGNITITNETRTLPADIINVPPLSQCCALKKPNSINSWPLDACKIFEELAAGGKTMFQFEILDDTSNLLSVKLSFDGKNIADILVPFVENISEDAAIKGVNETNKGEDVDINRLPEGSESKNQEIEENTDNSCLNTDYVVELTVDEIVQNMEVDKPREDEDTFNDHNNSIVTNKIDKITENLEHLKAQAEIETYSDKNEMQDIKIHAGVETVSEEVLSSTIQNVALSTISDSSDTESGLEGVRKEQNNVIISKSQICNTEMEISEPNINIQCSENVKDGNTSNLKEFVREQSVETLGETTGKDTSISVLKEETNILSIDETKKSSNKDCYTRDIDEVNGDIMDSKGCSDVSNRQDDEPLIDVTVSEKITDRQDDDPKISE